VARNKELYQWIKETRKPTQPEVETTVGLVGWYRTTRMDVGVEVYRSYVQDRFMVGLREVEGGPRYAYNPVNVNLQLTVTYRPGLRWGR
jgi:hypothetical protein